MYSVVLEMALRLGPNASLHDSFKDCNTFGKKREIIRRKDTRFEKAELSDPTLNEG